MTGRVVVVTGLPGVGKGTQCKKAAKVLGMVHLSTGDLFREAVSRGTELGRAVEPFMRRGEFVPDHLVVGVVKEKLEDTEISFRGVLLDGTPRSEPQSRELSRLGIVSTFIVLDAPDDVCFDRIRGRMIDPETGDIWNEKLLPQDDQIRARLIRRDDDRDEQKVKVRLWAYHRRIDAILAHFPGAITVDASRDVDVVAADFIGAILGSQTPP